MLADAHVPSTFGALERQRSRAFLDPGSRSYLATSWTPAGLRRLAARVAIGAGGLAKVPSADLERVWNAAVEAFRDPGSEERRRLDRTLAATCHLSPAGLAAGLDAVLGGAGGAAAAEIFRQAGNRLAAPRGPVLVVLAGNLPGLAVQPLLPALALRRPVVLKSSSAEPFFAPAFAAALARRLPAIGEALAAVTWRGGEAALEAPLLAAVEKVLAYGDADSLTDLVRRSPVPVLGYGPRISLAVLGSAADPTAVAPGLARDVALFDQRGCLSIHAVYTAGDPRALARELGRELERLAAVWPPGEASLEDRAAACQQLAEAELRGLTVEALPLGQGAVIVEPRPQLRPSPGLRIVRIHALEDLAALPELLEPWRERLQGAALAAAEGLEGALAGLGVTRFAPPGELQSPDATWHNGGVHPVEALG